VTTLSLHDPRTALRYAEGWATSIFVHGLVVAAAVLLLSDLKLAPQPEPFKWEVAMVQEVVPQPVETPPAPPPKPESPQPVRQPEIKPIVKPQPVQRVVQQEVREIRPIVQSQPITREREAVPVMNETVAIPKSEPIVQEARVAEPTPKVEEAPAVPAPAPEVAPMAQEPVTEQGPVAQEKKVEEAVVARAAPVQQEAPIRNHPVQARPTTRPDYSWLAEALWNRVERLKRYPHMARMNRWEGKVVLQAIVRDDGQLSELKVAQTSGYAVLDQDALEVLRRASPITLKHPLGQPQVVIQVPISYRLEH
jgi:protein TonB